MREAEVQSQKAHSIGTLSHSHCSDSIADPMITDHGHPSIHQTEYTQAFSHDTGPSTGYYAAAARPARDEWLSLETDSLNEDGPMSPVIFSQEHMLEADIAEMPSNPRAFVDVESAVDSTVSLTEVGSAMFGTPSQPLHVRFKAPSSTEKLAKDFDPLFLYKKGIKISDLNFRTKLKFDALFRHGAFHVGDHLVTIAHYGESQKQVQVQFQVSQRSAIR